jgi:hypothetical protein
MAEIWGGDRRNSLFQPRPSLLVNLQASLSGEIPFILRAIFLRRLQM